VKGDPHVAKRRQNSPAPLMDGVEGVRILVTNDDGVEAPGIAALARAAFQSGNEVVVVAPLEDWSGASAAVGAFYRRDGVDYRTFAIAGLEGVPTYGVDGPPALGVILACVGGFGKRPDIVLSGINHGVNVGRSALHSGTIGSVLTAAQFGIRGLATSIRYGPDPVPWNTAADLAYALIPVLETAPPATVLNLNVPDVESHDLQGVRAARLGRGGTIRSVSYEKPDDPDTNYADSNDPHPNAPDSNDAPTDDTTRASRGRVARHTPADMPPGPFGTMRLDLAVPGSAGQEAPAEHDGTDVDALLIGHNFATLTALVGVHEAGESREFVSRALGVLQNVNKSSDPPRSPPPLP
jgi:5'-nucleotidase